MGVTDGGVTDGARAIACENSLSPAFSANLNVILFKGELPAEKTKT
jgi:hypothetical protein